MSKTMNAVAIFLCAQAASASVAYGGGASLLIVASDSDPPIVELSGGFFVNVDFFDATNATPGLGLLLSYDAVLAYTDVTPFDAVGLGHVLANYVDDGGRVVVATYGMSDRWSIQGAIMTPGYNPLVNNGINGSVSGSVNAVVPGDPVFSTPNAINVGAITYFNNSNFAHPGLDGGALLLADDGGGIPLFAVNAAGNVGGLNMFPATSPAGNNAEFFEFLENTLVRVIVPACPWDLDANNDVGVGDLLVLLAAWGPNPGHPADFDGDSNVDIFDLLTLIANWGACP